MRRRAILLALVGASIVLATVYLSDFNKVIGLIINISPEYALLLLGLQLLSVILAAFKWRIILRHSKVLMRNLIPATFVGYFVNNITPIGLAGGEPVKAYIISKTDKIPMTTAISSVIVDLFLEIAPMFLFSGFAIYLIFTRHISPVLILFLAVIVLALIALFILAVNIVLSKRFSFSLIKKLVDLLLKIPLLRAQVKHLLPEAEKISEEFNDAIRLHMLDNTTLVSCTILSFIVWGIRFLRTYLIFQVIGVPVDFPTVIAVETMVSILSFIPLFPGAIGIWEGSSTLLYTMMTQPSVGEATAAAATIINRFYLFFIPIILGILAAVYLGINIRKVTCENEPIQLKNQT
jgi:uncharacterized protein (TIRG00374 family)